MKASGFPCPACAQDRTAEILELRDDSLRLHCPSCEHCWWSPLRR